MDEAPTLAEFLRFAKLSAQKNRAEHECARHAHALIAAVLADAETDDAIDWDELERAVYAHRERWSRVTVRSVLVRLLHWWRPFTAVPLPQLALLVGERPLDPLVHSGDRARAARFEALTVRWWERLPQLMAGDASDAAAALLVTALLRLDADDAHALKTIAHTSLTDLDVSTPDPGTGSRLLLETVTSLHVVHLRHRWPDAQTLIELTPEVMKACASECARLLDDPTTEEDAVGRMLQLAGAWRRRRLPRVMVEGRKGLTSVALDAPSWNRFAFGWGSPREAPPLPPSPAWIQTLEALIASQPDPAREVQQLRALAGRLGPGNAKKSQRLPISRPRAAEAVVATRNAHAWSALGHLMLQWAHQLLSSPDGPNSRSVSRYVGSLIPVLDAQAHEPVAEFGAQGEVMVHPDAWHAMLGRLAPLRDQQTAHTLDRLIRDLARRHAAFGALELDDLELGPGLKHRPHDVDPDAFEAAMATLWDSRSPWGEQAALIGALAYYAGLRRGELRGLRCVDVVDDATLLVCVRATGRRTLKSPAARRDVPLEPLLPAHWVDRLKVWLARMRAIDASRTRALLFADPALPLEPPPLHVFDQCIAAVRAMTGDAHLVFHSLRHVFATRGYLRLMLHAWPALRCYPVAAFAHPQFDPDAIASWRAGWMDPIEARRGTHDVHALSALLGHDTVHTTFRWYIHAHDLIERAVASLRLPEPPRALLATLSGHSPRTSKRAVEDGRAALRGRVAPNARWPSTWALLQQSMQRAAGGLQRAPETGEIAPADRRIRVSALPAIAGAIRSASWDPGLAIKLGVSEGLLSALIEDKARGRRLERPREHTEQQRFARAAAQADRLQGPRATLRAGCAAWREARNVRTTRRLLSGAATTCKVLDVLAPLLHAGREPDAVALDGVTDGVTLRAQHDTMLRLEAAMKKLGFRAAVRTRSAAALGWGRAPTCPDTRTPWILLRLASVRNDGTFVASPGLTLSMNLFSLLVTCDDL